MESSDQPASERSSVDERFSARIDELAESAARTAEEATPPESPPEPDRAMAYLREGAGPAISLYVEARTGGTMVHFPPSEYRALEGAMNEWLELYAECYGYDITASFTVREAAELLVDTHNVKDVAQLLTGVPERPSQ